MKRVFDLIGVLPDEIEAMRVALEKAGISYYETPRANWGQGQPGLWVKTDEQAVAAFKVIEEAQAEWRKRSISEKMQYKFKGPLFWLFVVFLLIILIGNFFIPGLR